MAWARQPAFSLLQIAAELGQIGLAQRPRFGQHVGQLLQTAEQGESLEGKIHLGRIEHVHHDHLVPPMSQVLQSGEHGVDVVEQVAQDDHDSPLLQPLGQVVKDRPERRFALGRGPFHDVQELLQVRRIAAGADQGADFAVEGDQSHAVLLMEHQVGQGRGGPLGVFQLRPRRGLAAVAHAFAGVQEQMADQVRLVLELLQIILVGPPKNFPIEIAEVVAGGILAVLGELDREAVKGAAVHARHVALDGRPGAQRQALQPGEHGRIEQWMGVFHGLPASPLPLAGEGPG